MAERDAPSGRLILEPIGVVRTQSIDKVDAPRQPTAGAGPGGRIELWPGRNFEHALEDLEGWELIWVIFWFHRNDGWRPKVLPPRSSRGRKGVFATRAPHRPNPLGLSAVRLDRIDGLTIHIRDADMVDGTPVLDIKPYVPYTDAHPAARSGWLESQADHAPAVDPVASWRVEFEPLAAAQARWIEDRTGLTISTRIMATLALGPKPHPYRRIRNDASGLVLAVKDWRAHFIASERTIRVLRIDSGYRPAQLLRGDAMSAEPLIAHRDFLARWPREMVS